MNSRIALSGLSILAALAIMGGATFAFFSDNETSTNNVFASGTLDLVLCDSDENDGPNCLNAGEAVTDGTTATFGGTNMQPGGTVETGTLTLRNNGSIDGNHVDIQFTNIIDEADTPPGDATTNPMDRFLEITTLTYDGDSLLPLASDPNGNGFADLDDLENLVANDLVNLDGIPAGGSKDLVISVRLHSSTPNDVQGDSVDTTLSVTLQQAPHASE